VDREASETTPKESPNESTVDRIDISCWLQLPSVSDQLSFKSHL